eukprot:2501680-Alexandrium_andersonii.AAC.1
MRKRKKSPRVTGTRSTPRRPTAAIWCSSVRALVTLGLTGGNHTNSVLVISTRVFARVSWSEAKRNVGQAIRLSAMVLLK